MPPILIITFQKSFTPLPEQINVHTYEDEGGDY